MSLGSIVKNVKARGFKDLLNPDKWSAYSQGIEIEENGIHLSAEEVISFSEQIVYRKLMCPECVTGTECVHCKCKMPISAITPVNFCSQGLWDKMMSPDEWEEFKKERQIKFELG